LSRELQELRDAGVLDFLGDGEYVLLDAPIHVETEPLPDDAIDLAIRHNRLRIGIVEADDEETMSRRRRGQARIRELTLRIYGNQCASCDIKDGRLLVASHISRWADDPCGRGDLSNVICQCRFHDALFECGYFSMSDDYAILRASGSASQMVTLVLSRTTTFREPQTNPPASDYLRKHRLRTGIE